MMQTNDLPIVEREVVRLIVLDAEERILLFRIREPLYPEEGMCWELPGGGIDSGETYLTAAVRELREETGILAEPSAVGPPVWSRRATFRHAGERRLQNEVVVVVRLGLSSPAVDEAKQLADEKERLTLVPQLFTGRTMKLIAITLFLVVTWIAYGQSSADGFYLPSNEASAPSILSQDGNRLSLGRAQVVAVQDSKIQSLDNANSRFWITVVVPNEVCAAATKYILVVSNQAYPSAGSSHAPGFCATEFSVSGADNARQVSEYLNTPIVYRKHPGHELLVSFTPTKPSFRIRDEVTATLRIENIGANTIAFMKGGRYRGASRDNQYTFSARFLGKQVPDIGTSNHFGGIAVPVVLKAGEVFTDTIDLSKWFAFDKKETYEILGSYSLGFVDPENVTPIWSDYVSAGFVVTIDD